MEGAAQNIAKRSVHVTTPLFILVIIFLLISFWWRERVWLGRMGAGLSAEGTDMRNLLPTVTPPPNLAAENFEIKAKLLYPLDGSTITETTPTIIGKVNQPATFLLYSLFELKNFIHYTDSIHRGISFFPSVMINTTVTLDGERVERVHGFPQYPYVLCRELVEGEYNQKITEAECAREKLDLLPPVIFLFQSMKPLNPGLHTLALEVADQTFNFQFTIDPTHTTPKQDLPMQLPRQYFTVNFSVSSFINDLLHISVFAGHDDPVRNAIDAKLRGYGEDVLNLWDGFLDADRCSGGYHYPSEYLPIPLPLTKNDAVFYKLHIPSQPNHLGAKRGTEVGIDIDMITYDLKLTDATNFYFDDEVWTQDNGRKRIEGDNAFYLPIRNLVFTRTGASLEPFLDEDEELPVVFNYLEFFPYDYAGQAYRENTLLYRTVNSSACDG